MRSTTGKYFIGLDHVRAVAVFMVFTWHFIHVKNWHLTPPVFPFSLLSEGHTGVALFMVLSGYLFAKLLDGKKIIYSSFIWNRFLRLAPLLLIVLTAVGLRKYLAGSGLFDYLKSLLEGFIGPTLPNGGWSVTTEFHFYFILPVLLFLSKKWKYSPAVVLVAALIMRILLYREIGSIQFLSFWTIVGRIDQFLLGILAFQFKEHISGRHLTALGLLLMFAFFYRYFDASGGFYFNPSYPSSNPIWIYLPTIEGIAYAVAVSWYDNSFKHSEGKISRFLAMVGTYSYSIYLLHVFFVFKLAAAIDRYLIDLADVHLAIFISFFCFFVTIPVAHFSYTAIESRFMKYRKIYIVSDQRQYTPGQITCPHT